MLAFPALLHCCRKKKSRNSRAFKMEYIHVYNGRVVEVLRQTYCSGALIFLAKAFPYTVQDKHIYMHYKKEKIQFTRVVYF